MRIWYARRYWYPLAYCLSLALQPSALIGLNADLKLPKLQVGDHPDPLLRQCSSADWLACLANRTAVDALPASNSATVRVATQDASQVFPWCIWLSLRLHPWA